MIKQTIKFLDFNDQEREVTEYFHLSESEIVELQARSPEGIEKELDNAIKSGDVAQVLDFIKDLVHRSYGRKSQDGIQFRKSPEILDEFINSAYYSDFILGLIENDGARGVEFIQGIMPKKLLERALQQVRGETVTQPESRTYTPSAREQFAQRTAELKPEDRGTFGQPAYPQVSGHHDDSKVVDNGQTPQQSYMSTDELLEFRKWQEQQKSAQNETPVEGFRVREEEPSVSRPPHEQLGDNS